MRRATIVGSLWFVLAATLTLPSRAQAHNVTPISRYAHRTGASQVSRTAVRTTRAGNTIRLVEGIGSRVDTGGGGFYYDATRSHGERFVTISPSGRVLTARRSQTALVPTSPRQLIDTLAVLAHGDPGRATTGLAVAVSGPARFDAMANYLFSHPPATLRPALRAELSQAVRAGRARALAGYPSFKKMEAAFQAGAGELGNRLGEVARWEHLQYLVEGQ
jgi:hypothetical protein